MPTLANLAEQICIVGRQAGIPRSTNEIGRGVDVRKADSPLGVTLEEWSILEPSLKAWLEGEDLAPKVRVWPRVDHRRV